MDGIGRGGGEYGRMGAMGGGMGLQILNALRQALTRSAGAARQRHTTEGRKTAPHDNDDMNTETPTAFISGPPN